MKGQNGTKVASHIKQRRIDSGAMESIEDARVRNTVDTTSNEVNEIIPKIEKLNTFDKKNQDSTEQQPVPQGGTE